MSLSPISAKAYIAKFSLLSAISKKEKEKKETT